MMRATRVCTTLLFLMMEGSVQARDKVKPDNTCRSAGVLKFDPETRPTQRTGRIEVCSKYSKKTCCNSTHAHALRLKIREPVVAKFSSRCQALTEEMVCSSCHPLMGTWELRNVCPSLCNDWYDACKGEYYAYSGAGTLTPCYGNALICSPLKAIVGSGADFCVQMGFHVGSDADVEGTECFDGSVPEKLIDVESHESWKTRLQHMLEQEAENPSGLFIAGVFIVITMLLMGSRLIRQFGDPFGGDQLSLMEVRRLQQERYERGEQIYDETDSSSDEERLQQSSEDEADDERNNIST